MKKNILQAFLFLPLLAACQASKITTGVLDVNHAWARPAASGNNGAVYFVIENGTSQEDVLLSGQTDIASAVELHLSEMEGDHMSMHHQEQIVLPAGEAVDSVVAAIRRGMDAGSHRPAIRLQASVDCGIGDSRVADRTAGVSGARPIGVTPTSTATIQSSTCSAPPASTATSPTTSSSTSSCEPTKAWRSAFSAWPRCLAPHGPT